VPRILRAFVTCAWPAATAISASTVSKDTVLEWIYRYARQARLVDGANEVHKMVLAEDMRAEGRDFWHWRGAES